jgi:hypothetical protein
MAVAVIVATPPDVTRGSPFQDEQSRCAQACFRLCFLFDLVESIDVPLS